MLTFIQQDSELFSILPQSIYDANGLKFYKIIKHKCEYPYNETENQGNKENIANAAITNLPTDVCEISNSNPERGTSVVRQRGRDKNRSSDSSRESSANQHEDRQSVSQSETENFESEHSSTSEDVQQDEPELSDSVSDDDEQQSDTSVKETRSRKLRKSNRETKPAESKIGDKSTGNRFNCQDCDASYKFKRSLLSHVNSKHKGIKPPTSIIDEKKFQCDKCGATFKHKCSLLDHASIHAEVAVRPFKCDQCGKSFRVKQILRSHLKTHVDDKKFQCEFCGYRCSTKASLHQHNKSHTDERPYPCHQCDMKFRLKHHLKNHLLVHTGEKKYLCTECGKESRQLAHHLKHLTLHKNRSNLKCEKCGLVFQTEQFLKDHSYRVHDGGPGIWRCSDCPLIFHESSKYKAHRVAAHFSKKYMTSKTSQHECEICGLRCRSQATLGYHKRTHTNEKPFKCTSCDYSCNLKSQLTLHLRIHTGEKPHQCETCGKSFRLHGQLAAHRNTHLDARPHKCNQCDAAFRQIGHLHFHKKHKHKTNMMHSCDVCGTNFRLKKELKNHKIVHTSETSFQCETCSTVFSSKSLFDLHVKVHETEGVPKSFMCDSCGSVFNHFTELFEHRRNLCGPNNTSNANDKPFKCGQCQSAFKTKANLRKHELRHRKKKAETEKNENFARRTAEEGNEGLQVAGPSNVQQVLEQTPGNVLEYNVVDNPIPASTDFQTSSFIGNFQQFVNYN